MENNLYIHLLMASAVLLLILTATVIGFAHLLRTLRQKDQEKLQAILKAEENERSSIARELHDKLSPLLSIAQLQLGYLQTEPSETNARTLAPYLHQQLTEALKLSRDLSHQLAPLKSSQDLQAALKAHIHRIHASQQLRIELICQHDLQLSPKQATSLHRILQELLNNTLKHAGAQNATIALSQDPHHTQLRYSDDGIGLSPQNLYQGLGTQNIQSRVTALQGKIQWNESQQKLDIQILLPRTKRKE